MKKRLFFVAAAALLPGLAVLAFNEVSYRAEREQEVHRQVAQASRQVASEISRIVEGVHGLLNAVAAIPAVRQRDVPACNEALKGVASGMAPIRVVFLLGLDGKVVCSSSDQVVNQDFADRRYFRDALATPKLVIGEHTKSRFSGVGILPIVKSIPDADGKVLGVLATGLRLDWLGQQLLERGIPNGGALTIADRDGTIISRNPDPERFVGTRIPEAFQHLVNAKGPGTLEVKSQDGEIRIIGYQPVSTPPEGLYISSGLSKQAFAGVDRASLIGAVLISVGAIAAFAAAGFIGNTFIRRPVAQLNAVLTDWRAGRPATRTGMKAAQGELESVGESLDALLDTLAKREAQTAQAEKQRDLAMHELSHRVKNTLTIVQAFARQTFGPDADKERVRAFSDRIAALAETYDLLLSKEQEAGEMRLVLAAALKPHQGLTQRIVLDGPQVELTPDMVLSLSMVVHELATNAVKYGALRHDDGKVTIRWSLEGGLSTTRLALTWRERDGPPISPPDREGFGTKLINRAFPSDLEPAIELAYPVSGLVCSLSFDYAQAQDLAA